MPERLISGYDGLVCDLDGVVYAGPSAVPHAVESLMSARADGRKIVYATNNASRPPQDVATHLRELGIQLDDADVVNSSMAAAHVLTGMVDDGSRVLTVGGSGVSLAVEAGGFTPVAASSGGAHEVAAVVQGYGANVTAADLAEAAYAIQAGAQWVATNTDRTLPTDRGVAPGNGSLVAAVRLAVDVDPAVAGKPMPVMYDMAAERMEVAPGRVLAIGDRLETDVEGARRGDYDSVLVLTGVHTLADAAAAPDVQRPTFVLADLRGLDEPYVVAVWDPAKPSQASDPSGEVSLPVARGFLAHLWDEVDAGRVSADDARARMAALTVTAHE